MFMKILIDAFNLIYKFPDLELCMYEDRLDEAKEGLIRILSEVQSTKQDVEFLLFVDGKKVKGDYDTLQENRNGMDIYYSQEKEADDLIRVYIKESSHPNRLQLVTSDKKIIQFAKQFKVKCISSENYSTMVREILEPTGPDLEEEDKPSVDGEGVDRSEMDLWLREFSGGSPTRNQSRTK